MIFGVPSGGQQIHVDIDLSDIGILSQKPIDFIYKGYNSTQFENAQQFKESTNLDGLTQILSQNQSVHVYPFWGDKNLEEIAISRCDIQVQYKFEPTCVFFGAIMTDNYNNNIGHKCSSSKFAGFNRHLVTGEGTIEMIRKTPDNLVEEFQIQGNRLIDGDGVWCYQIPMNLDFVGTDEFGNIIPIDDPKKGIPTRTSVRFRVSMQETGNEGVSRHRAKYLIPNVQQLIDEEPKPHIESGKKFEQCYEFGSATPDEYYRDLYWNKVYSVKNYIPRIQTNGKKNTQNYSAIRTVNSNNDVNPVPYNHARFRLAFGYRVLCMIMTIVFTIICAINALLSGIAGFKLPLIGRVFKWLCSLVKCIGVSGGLTEDEDANIEYFPCCNYSKCIKCGTKGCTPETDLGDLLNVVQQSLSQEYDTVNLDFHNDWLNGSLYLPLWFWKKTKKKKFLFGLFSKKAVNSFCSCSKNFPKLRVTQGCSLPYNKNDYKYKGNDKGEKYHDYYPEQKTFTIFGVIKEFVNKAELNIYYYAPGIPNVPNYKELDEPTSYVRLYSTDIILLGSLNSCDLDNYPNVFTNLPTTTVNVPFIATIKQALEEEEGATYMEGTAQEQGFVEVTGMDWLNAGEKGKPKYGEGLFIDLACNAVYTKPKSCVNLERLCELGVTLDTYMEVPVAKNGTLVYNTILADGMITRYEIVDNETRAMFASLNNNGLTEKVFNPNTGYDTYKLRYVYPIDFDGHMAQAEAYTSMMEFKTYDWQDPNYIEYRFGPRYDSGNKLIMHYYSDEGGNNFSFPVFNNSFYFYFGIHEGSTAIDKFNSRFYASCYKNEKYPFTMLITTEPAKWCAEQDTDYGTINIELNGIKSPYSYKLVNEFNEEILEENGLYGNELHFGYKIETDGGAYQYDNDGKLIKSGIFTEFLTGKDTEYKVENGTYKITITDTNGNVGNQTIVIEQVPISLIYETVEMGDKFYNDEISKESDFCNPNEFFGEIRISGVTIDGRDYRINDFAGGNGEYNLALYSNVYNDACQIVTTEQEQVLLQIAPQANEEDNDTFKECTCHGVGGYAEARLLTSGYTDSCGKPIKVLQFPIWKPKTFKINVTQYCNGELNDNTSEIMANVKNGAPFNAYINEVPLKFILGKNEQFNSYNTNFYKVGASVPTQIPGWFGLHKESTYIFSGTTIQYESIWSDFTTVNSGLNTNDDVNDRTEYITEESLYNILEFKFKSLFNLSKGAYVVGDSDSKMTITHSGGKTPILYRGHYPQYSEFVGEETPTSGNGSTFQLYIANSEGSITCNNYYPNIVGHNYTYINPTSGISVVMSSYSAPYFNRTYNDFKNMGNYFAAFTKNGGIIDDGDENCRYDEKIMHQQIPYKASAVIDDLVCLDDEVESNNFHAICYRGGGNFKPYFRGEFVDRRLDYDFMILTPYAGDDVMVISEDDIPMENVEKQPDPIWKKGRFSGVTMNGVEMVYNNTKEYEVIGPELEYYYNIYPNDNTNNSVTIYNPKKEGDKYVNGINIVDKRYYKTILKCSNKKYDINDMYWAYDANGSVTYTGRDTKLRNPNDYGFELVVPGVKPHISEIFSYDHSANFNDGVYNGDFSVSNYPTKRLLDIGNVPSCEKLTFNCSSCSYNVDAGVANGEDELLITGSTEETDELEFMIDCRNMINPELPSLEECAAKGDGDLLNVKFVNNNGEFTPNRFNLKCKVKPDSYNNTHEVYSEYPVLCWVKRKGINENQIGILKNSSKTITEVQSKINEIRLKNFDYDDSTVKDIKRVTKAIKRGPFTFNIGGRYWVTSSDPNVIAYDDNTNVKNVVYTVGRKGIGIEDYDVLSVFLKRNYLNNSGDNLNKNISTIQFTAIYDVRPFAMDMCCEELIENRLPVTGTATVEVPTSSTEDILDEETGEVIGEETTTGTTDATGDIDAGASIKHQHIILKVKTEYNNIHRNQQFFEIDDNGNPIVDKLTAVLGIKIDGRKTTSDIQITCEKVGNNINVLFDIMFTGELEQYSLDGGDDKKAVRDRPAALYISMPNKLVYMLDFKFKDIPSTNDCCPSGE